MDDWDFMFLIGEIHLIRGRMENLVNEFSILDFPTPEDITYGDDDEDTDQWLYEIWRARLNVVGHMASLKNILEGSFREYDDFISRGFEKIDWIEGFRIVLTFRYNY